MDGGVKPLRIATLGCVRIDYTPAGRYGQKLEVRFENPRQTLQAFAPFAGAARCLRGWPFISAEL